MSPLTLTEKILRAHLRDPDQTLERGETYATFDLDRVALQDALAQIVALQFMVAGLDRTVVPTTVHCDHLIRARAGAAEDLRTAEEENGEIYDFLRSVSVRYGLDFWGPGSGIIHQVVLENYAAPGGMMIGTDSHTPNAGGLGMIAIGAGGGDAIDAMTGLGYTLRWPRIIGVHLTGRLSGWASPKDVILTVADRLTVSGGTDAVIEYFGAGADTIAATGKATICNMGAEVGATCSIFPFDTNIDAYLRATGRGAVADDASSRIGELRADPEVVASPADFFDQVITIDLSALRPLINGPDTPDRAHRVGEVGAWARAHGVPTHVSAALVGSCTNSSYQDMTRAASVARQAAAAGRRALVPLFVTPGSERIRATIERDGLLADLEAIGATVLANGCGPCIGQWDRLDGDPATTSTIVTSFNRNFPRRNDGRPGTRAFVTSPEMVIAYAITGTLDADPTADLLPPTDVQLPSNGFAPSGGMEARGTGTDVHVAPDSERLQLLEPFPAWDGTDYVRLPVLVKAAGKCTTDHISAAGRWLRYRGHLEHISANLFLGAVNAFTGETGVGIDPTDGQPRPFPEIARRLSEQGTRWCVIGDANYGEGSSREHAAMEPRYRGAVVVIARSFARIHETNLKKQGILALRFVDPATYDAIGEGDRISVVGLADLAPRRPVSCFVEKVDGSRVAFAATHTCDAAQLDWFRAGSALNVIRSSVGRRAVGPSAVEPTAVEPTAVSQSSR